MSRRLRWAIVAIIGLLVGLSRDMGLHSTTLSALLQPAVTYPVIICVGALGATFFGYGGDRDGHLKVMLLGLFITCAVLGLSWLFGTAPETLKQALLFRAGKAFAWRQVLGLGYLLTLTGLLMLVRSLVDLPDSNTED